MYVHSCTSRTSYVPLKNASISEAFPTTLTVRTKKSEPRLICEKDPSPLPHWKLSGTMCCQPSHTTHRLKSPLIPIAGNLIGVSYRDEILWVVAIPFVQQHHLIFQQDNAHPHVVRVCLDFLINHNINPLDWPPSRMQLILFIQMFFSILIYKDKNTNLIKFLKFH
jgi:hypothetical protein